MRLVNQIPPTGAVPMNDEICIDKRANSQSLGPEPLRFPIQGYVYYEGCRTPIVNVSSLKASEMQETNDDKKLQTINSSQMLTEN